MKHLGDFDTSTVLYGKFTTFRPSTGAAFTLGGTPALSVYKDNSTTQSTTGVTLTVDFDSVTGLHHYAIDTSADGTFYSAGSFFDIVITTGTVDSVSVVGSVVASFTIRKNSALKPATAGRTLVVDASGLADANMVKLGPTGAGTAQTARDIGASVLLSSGTGTGQLSLSSGLVTLAGVTHTGAVIPTVTTTTTATNVTTVNGLAAGVITASSIAADAITDAKVASDVTIASVTGAVGSVTAAVTVGTINSGVITATSIAADAIGASELAADAVAEIQSGLATSSALAAVAGYVDTEIAAIQTDVTTLLSRLSSARAGYLDNLGGGAVALASSILDAAGLRSALGLASANLDTQLDALPTAVENADALLGRNVAGGSSTGRTVKEALYFLRNKWIISGGTLTVYATDDSTSAWTAAVTQTAGDPVSASDPA